MVEERGDDELESSDVGDFGRDDVVALLEDLFGVANGGVTALVG